VRLIHRPSLVFILALIAVLLAACGPSPEPGSGNSGLLVEQPGSLAGAPAGSTRESAGPPIAATSVPVSAGESAPLQVFVPTPAAIESRPLTALGDPAAPVTIVEYSDYQCPFCQRHFAQTLPQLLETYVETGRVYYVFKDFPIDSLHPLAYRLHEAALCAGDQAGEDGYWQAHDLFFGEPASFQTTSLAAMDEAILTALGDGDYPDIASCLSRDQFAAEVQAGVREGQRLGITGTPTFYINGYPIVGAQPYATFEYAISLAEAGELENAFREAAEQQAAAAATATAVAAIPVDIPLADAPAMGDPAAPVTIVEYSDYQCPFCWRHFQETIPQLQPYIDSGQVRYVFKDLPIRRSHPEAQKAHEAARCAREQGGDEAYWQMHDLIFASQQQWGGNRDHVAVLKGLAAEAGYGSDAFAECLDTGRYEDAVSADLMEGSALGVSGTPTFFINGIRLVGAQPFSVFEQAITAALQ
jgi:protein-disulfide isomerase